MNMHKKNLNRVILGAFCLSGTSALMYEVIWTRALSLVLGSTVYAMSLMLSTFMAGLAIGSLFGGRLSDRTSHHLRVFGICELIIGLCGIISIPAIYEMPKLYLALYRLFHLSPPLFFLMQMVLCSLVMIIPTTMMGATFPLVSRIVTDQFSEMGTKVGRAYFWNTIGAVAGSLLAGFVTIPLLGMKGAAFSAAILNITVGVLLVIFAKRHWGKSLAIFAIPLLMGCYWSAYASQEPFLINYYTAYRADESVPYKALSQVENRANRLVFSGEYAEGNVKAFKQDDGSLVLQVGGKTEGTARGDRPNTMLLAYLPIATHPDPRDILVIGLGAGVTVGAAKGGNRQVDLVEINPGVIEAVAQHGSPGLLDGVKVIQADARNYLLTTDKKYDIISSEPSYPSESSVANLFTQEFYRIAAEKLNRNGLYCQWLPYYLLSNNEITMMLKTFTSVFSHAYLWKVSMDLILVGSREPGTFSSTEIMQRVAALKKPDDFLEYRLSRSPEQLREIAVRRDVPLNTDDLPLLEFAAINNFILGDLYPKEKAGR